MYPRLERFVVIWTELSSRPGHPVKSVSNDHTPWSRGRHCRSLGKGTGGSRWNGCRWPNIPALAVGGAPSLVRGPSGSLVTRVRPLPMSGRTEPNIRGEWGYWCGGPAIGVRGRSGSVRGRTVRCATTRPFWVRSPDGQSDRTTHPDTTQDCPRFLLSPETQSCASHRKCQHAVSFHLNLVMGGFQGGHVPPPPCRSPPLVVPQGVVGDRLPWGGERQGGGGYYWVLCRNPPSQLFCSCLRIEHKSSVECFWGPDLSA